MIIHGQPVSSSASETPIFFFACRDSYNKVCGQVRDINLGSPNVFLPYNFNININAIYVDGISSTNDSNPRKIYQTHVVHLMIEQIYVTSFANKDHFCQNICDLICEKHW